MRTITRLLVLSILALIPMSAWAAGEGFTDSQVIQEGDALATRLGIAADKRTVIRDQLQGWMGGRRVSRFGGTPIVGVFAYKLGAGGLIIEAIKGTGLLRYNGEDKDRPIKIKSVTAGAVVGGSAESGVGVILGPSDPMGLPGKYRVTQLGAAAGSGTSNVEATKEDAGPGAPNRLVLLGATSGLAGNAGGGSFTLIVGP